MEQLREPAKLMDAGMGVYQLVSAIECWNNIGFVPDPLLHLGSYLSEDGLNVRNSSIGATLSADSNSRSETLDMPCTVLPAIDATYVLTLPLALLFFISIALWYMSLFLCANKSTSVEIT